MQLGIRLHDIAPGTLEERLSIARQQGFKCGHLALTKVLADYPGNQALTPGYAMYLRKLFAKYDIDIAVLGNYKNLANPDEYTFCRPARRRRRGHGDRCSEHELYAGTGMSHG